MNLGLQAFGVPLSADPGSSYNYNQNAPEGPAVKSMDGPFVSNTVIVDAKDQLRGKGLLVSWHTTPQFQSVVAEIEGIYPGVHWRRSVALVNGTVVVVDDLSSDRSHRYECAWHHLGEATNDGRPLDSSFDQGEYAKLLHPKNVEGSPIEFNWKTGGVTLHLWQDAPDHARAYTAQTGICWENVKGLPITGLYTRTEGKTARFVSVLDPHKGAAHLSSVRRDGDRITLRWADGTEHTVRVSANAMGNDAIKLE
jgi:hypothetical protein